MFRYPTYKVCLRLVLVVLVIKLQWNIIINLMFFNEETDFLLMELNTRFFMIHRLNFLYSMQLWILEIHLNHLTDICTLTKKFYPKDFSKQDIRALEYELRHYELDIKSAPRFQVSTFVELYRQLIESRRLKTYIIVTRLIRLILTLSVSINGMEDGFLADCITLFM